MNKLTIHSHVRNYDVIFEGTVSFLDEYIARSNHIFVIDSSVHSFYKEKLFTRISSDKYILIDAKEDNKNLSTVRSLYDTLLQKTAKKNLTIIAIGGGIVQDIVGFVCSTLYRGIGWVCIPTTLLSQVDSCIGSKTSLNYKAYKNMLGTFYPPHKVHICQDFLKTLLIQDIYCGMGEIVKLQLMDIHTINDVTKISQCVQTVRQFIKDRDIDLSRFIHTCLEIKKKYVESDEFDLGIRNLLNYGHEFGHALESASAFSIPHGIAVTVGIIFANAIAVQRGLLAGKLDNNITKYLLLPALPFEVGIFHKRYFSSSPLLKGMKKDKKLVEQNKLVVVVLKNNFQIEKLTDITEAEFMIGLSKVKKILFLNRKGVL